MGPVSYEYINGALLAPKYHAMFTFHNWILNNLLLRKSNDTKNWYYGGVM